MNHTFRVGNVKCQFCNHSMWYVEEQSSDTIAVFICKNKDCNWSDYFMRDNEVIIEHIQVEKR